ncbi:glycosyltransferase family 2 protein [Candidatus Uabimicrobium amorphum]|uniref:Glycosyl transferase n=1 Tax=Uabimicrobium amorphum TaxID=2596890 RepID=A0A5S9IPJ9_UABAM|nr:glycosyltransferase family 2 protein [Candidatus Uabimicrobium amorphum]BBM85102.1 glycosyl transferase [Candidatus Uabimicrobium amorphum]
MKKYLSIVIPLFNEQDNVETLLKHLKDSVTPLNKSYEIILVDDGSKDETWERISEAAQHDCNVKGIRFARNFGHQHALLAGLHAAEGEAVISMDGDLQHPPSTIKNLIEEHHKGYLVVNTCRNDVKVASFFKRTTSHYFYKIFSILTNVPMSSGTSDFRLLDHSVVKHILEFQDVDLFLRGAVAWLGYRSTTVPYEANARHSGVSKYNLKKMIRFAAKSIISFSVKPLVLGIWIGIITSMLAFLEIVYVVVQFSRGVTVPGWASIIGIVSFLFGILFILLGIIGVYLSRIHMALQNRPKFVIQETTSGKEHL